jgi:hypothetical protein
MNLESIPFNINELAEIYFQPQGFLMLTVGFQSPS